jgi:hypothetical protein
MRTLAILVALAATARADTLVDVAGEIGGGTDGFVFGVRPELVLAHYADSGRERGIGIGVAGELLRAGGHGLLGGSLEFVGFRHELRLEPSLGLYERLADDAVGASASVLVGFRAGGEAPPFEGHVGVRLTGRSDRDESAIELTAQLDPVFLAKVAVGAILAKHAH